MSEEITLPEHQDVCNLIESGGIPTALEQFIYDHEPAGVEDEATFRDQLLAVIKEAKGQQQ